MKFNNILEFYEIKFNFYKVNWFKTGVKSQENQSFGVN
jgi:hypothetical protein